MFIAENRRAAWLCLLATCLAWATAAAARSDEANEDDDFGPQYVPGLVGRYIDAERRETVRRDERVAFVWDAGSPDARLGAQFQASWKGRLWTQIPGRYRLHVFGAGKIKLSLSGEVLIEGESKEPRWFASEPVKQQFGYHRLQIEFEKLGDAARLSLYWSGPNFDLEPISERWLFHDPEESPNEQFERGRTLVRALRCAACHRLPVGQKPLSAPALDGLAGAVDRDWLLDWLSEGTEQHSEHNTDHPASTFSRRMPHFNLKRKEAEAIAAALVHATQVALSPAADDQQEFEKNKGGKNNNKKKKGKKVPSGEQLALTLGCLACHKIHSLGTADVFGGGDLSAIAEKRPPAFFAKWLAAPEKLNRDHRMPVFRLSDQERDNLAGYLAKLRDGSPAVGITADMVDQALLESGKTLIAKHRCQACHRLPEGIASSEKPPGTPSLAVDSNWREGCIGEAKTPAGQPHYEITDSKREAIRRYLAALPNHEQPAPEPLAGALLLRENNCLNCHGRGLGWGIFEVAQEVVARHSRLKPLLPALTPPALDSVGDKLHDQALKRVLAESPSRRPWLKVQMPRFRLLPEQREALLAHLIHTDRVPERPEKDDWRDPPPEVALEIAGRRLVTADGFGCTSCHKIGKQQPFEVELKAIGPDLSMLSRHVRRSWYDRWMRDPARMVPRMEMPAVKIPVRGVLKNRIDDQLAAVWHILNQPGFTPSAPNPIRVLRRRNIPDSGERAVVMTDNLEAAGRTFVKPLLIALPNRHNVLFDLRRQRLAGWTIGDSARQRTRGKYWYWEAAGTPLAKPSTGPADLALVHDGEVLAPAIDPHLPPPFQFLAHIGSGRLDDGVAFQSRLEFELPGKRQARRSLAVRQEILPTPTVSGRNPKEVTGFSRRLHVAGLAPGEAVRIACLPLTGKLSIDPRRKVATIEQAIAYRVMIQSRDLQFIAADDPSVEIPADEQGVAELSLFYSTAAPLDRYEKFPPKVEPDPVAELPIVPGWNALQLAMPEEIMPTGFAWRQDGRLVITSLKNRVWQAEDRNSDGLEDRFESIGDEYLAPYGAAVRTLADGPEVIDIVDKTAVLRLHDRNGDDYFERTETLAAGWGHSTDYHGWAVGLPQDAEGNYFVGLSQRGGPKEHLRGRVLKIVPNEAPDAALPYRIEPITAGHRYPVGIARNREGDLFVTDNQGNYNPFNELNHVVPGSHYGFVAGSDSHEVTSLPRRGPVVAIRHPWTRSVNGICALDTPPEVEKRLGRKLFGPFEGHLIGCEYDTRRLVRMSLEPKGDSFQGAVYPFSLPTRKNAEAGLLGPVVCAVSPAGHLYVGSLRDSAWGAGRNTGQLVRLSITEELPPGIAEVREVDAGLEIRFTRPVDAAKAANPESYALQSYHRIATPAYGGPDRDRRSEKILAAKVSDERRSVVLHVAQKRPGHVYELRVQNLTEDASEFFPAEAHFSLGPMPQ